MLDPAYTCVYQPRPGFSSITPNPNYVKNARSVPSTSKRSLSPVIPNGDGSSPHTHKKRRMDPEVEEREVEQLLSSEPPQWRPKPPQRSRSGSRKAADKKPGPILFTQPPLESVQELQDADMEDLAGTPAPNSSQSTTTEKRKGMYSPCCSADVVHASTQRIPTQMERAVRVHSGRASAYEQNRQRPSDQGTMVGCERNVGGSVLDKRRNGMTSPGKQEKTLSSKSSLIPTPVAPSLNLSQNQKPFPTASQTKWERSILSR